MQSHEIEPCLTIYAASFCLRLDLATLALILQSVYSLLALLPTLLCLFSAINARQGNRRQIYMKHTVARYSAVFVLVLKLVAKATVFCVAREVSD